MHKKLVRLQKYYDRYERKLFDIMEALDVDDDVLERSKALSDALARYDKAAHKFMELSDQVDTYLEPKGHKGGLDIYDAKKEILERIDRFNEAGGSKADTE